MSDNELSLKFTELAASESAAISGGANVVNFDTNSYLFIIGAGAVFDGGVTSNVRDIAFKQSIYTSIASTQGTVTTTTVLLPPAD